MHTTDYVAALVGLQHLRYLDLTGTQVPQEDLAELRAKLPKCEIYPKEGKK